MIWLALLASNAQAWEVLQGSPHAWDPSTPLVIHRGEEAASPGMTPEETQAAMDAAIATWNDVPCTGGLELQAGPIGPSPSTFDMTDGEIWITIDDPDGLLEPGVLGSTLTEPGAHLMTVNGTPLTLATQGDVGMNDNVLFTTHEKVLAGDCDGETNLQGSLTLLIGFLLGLGPSDVPGSAMESSYSAPCDPDHVTLSADDIQGLQALYGFRYDVSCDQTLGVPPFDVSCSVVPLPGASVPTVTWTLPDGTSPTTTNAGFSVSEAGAHVVEVCMTVDECTGGEMRCDTQVIAACDNPTPVIDWEVQTMDHLEPGELLLSLEDATDQAAACAQTTTWTLTDADGLDIEVEWTWLDSRPSAVVLDGGLYTATLSLTTPAGSNQTTIEIDLRDAITDSGGPGGGGETEDKCGCDHSGSGLMLAGWMLPLAFLRRRRPSVQRGSASGTLAP